MIPLDRGFQPGQSCSQMPNSAPPAQLPSRRRAGKWPILIGVVVPAIVFLLIAAVKYDGQPYLRGDSPYYVATALSIAQDHDLDLSNQLWQPWSGHDTHVAQDSAGRWVPKHPLWMPVASLPLIVTAPFIGPLVFNLLQIVALVLLMFVLAQRVTRSPWAAAIASTLTAFLSFLPAYVVNYSPDIFTSVLFFGALVALPPDRSPSFVRHILAGALLGMAVTAKPSFALVLPLLPLIAGRPLRRSLMAVVLGMAAPIVLWLGLNTHLFGAPLTTPYDRIVHFGPTGIELQSNRDDFNFDFLGGAIGQLTDSRRGLLRTSPVTVISFLFLPWWFFRNRPWAAYVGFSALGIFLFFSAYSLWPTSHWGNRFLMPVVALGVLPLAAALSRWLPERFRAAPNQLQPNDVL